METTLGKIAEMVGGDVVGDATARIRGAAPFDAAQRDDITFAAGAGFLKRMADCRAGGIIVPSGAPSAAIPQVRVANPELAFAKVLTLFFPIPKPVAKISDRAVIGPGFVCGADSCIGPQVVIGRNVTIGDRVTLAPHVYLGDNVTVGDDTRIFPNVTVLERCRIGKRVILQAGSVIGGDGFGFARDGKIYYKIPQTGIVQIDDDVEIGASNTIDRASFGKTWIQRGVKTDNLVHIAHNVTVGEDTVIVAQVGVAGSVRIGRNVILAGQVGISGHIEIGDDVMVGPQSGVGKSIPSGQVMTGSAAMPHRLWLRVQRIMPRLPEIAKKLVDFEKRLVKMEKTRNGG